MVSLVLVVRVEEDGKRYEGIVVAANNAYNSCQCDESRPVSQTDFLLVGDICSACV
jgi:hypothetical protein